MAQRADVHSSSKEATPMAEQLSYEDRLRVLSEGSVNLHFDPFRDIAWDDPAHRIDGPADPRLVLPTSHVLGAHEWYQSLPLERQAEIGRWTFAEICRIGLQFENLLIRGLMAYAFRAGNGDPEFRYVTHEATEECHHTQMFQEFVNRSGADVRGLRRYVSALHHLIPTTATWAPSFFFLMVLGGEEPIDHLQKHLLRAAPDDLHPLMGRIMQIHVAEEARHISFAHEYLARSSRDFGPIRRAWFSVLFPLVMRMACHLILKPSRRTRRQLGIPRQVYREVWWRSPDSAEFLRDTFADVRMLAERMGLMNRFSRLVWRLLRIDGRASRFRGEHAGTR